MYSLERAQIIDTSLVRAWDFLKNPANLNSITPDDLHFRIISPVPERMFNGLLIEYRITIPCFGTRTWIAEIKHIHEHKSFVDEQRLGPYKFWYHYHELQTTEEGVKIIDRVHYALPFGIFGQFLHRLFIRRMLERIFNFRTQKLAEIILHSS